MKKRNILYKIFMCVCVCILMVGCGNTNKHEEVDNNQNNVIDKTDVNNQDSLIDNNQNDTTNKVDNKEENKNDIESNKNDNKTDSNKNTNNEEQENNPKLSASSKTLEKGKTFTLKVTNNKGAVSWMTSNKKVATVSNGKVTAVEKGTVTITASVDGKKLTCKITVKERTSNTTNNTTSNTNTTTDTESNNTVTNPKLNSINVTINEDKTYQLKVTGNKGKVQWMTVDSSIAIVDNSGVIRPTKAGKTTVQAIVDGKTLICNVTVKEVKVEAKLSKETFNLINKEREKAGLPPYEWDSSLGDIAKMRAEECLVLFDHIRPNGTPALSSLNLSGEILTGGYSDSDAVERWMNSSGHKKIVLKENASKCAVAKVYDKNNGYYIWVAVMRK